ncbi:MAG TPA: tripartite tricarboxylate transporter substrate binding protein [Xanthobacteraceae bacterium]|nr:tripartite tricarboxylate transporter substrate binding protein [Xanthobacteraceae bacterium]
MNVPRRQFLQLTAGAAALPAFARDALAQSYPSRPVRWIVGFAPGGGNDIVARLMGQWLSERLGQPFIVDNRPGGGANIATEAVVNAAPDGYTLLMAGIPNATNAALYPNLKFNFMREIMPVVGILRIPNVMVVHPSFPARTLPEFLSFAKANPGKINMASPGTGSGGHLSGELFKLMAGVNLVHVPFRGNGPALTALIGGQVDVLFPSPPSSIEHIRAGQLRGLAVTSAARSAALPDLPTIAEFVPGYEMTAWFGVGVPKGTPADIIDRLNREINSGLSDPKLQARFVSEAGTVIGGSPADFGKLIADETEKWAKVIAATNMKPE